MSRFGVTPGEIAQIAADWTANGESLADLRPTPPNGGSTSRVVNACIEFCTQAAKVSAADAARLTALGAALARFDAESSESDRASAAAIGAASAGGPR